MLASPVGPGIQQPRYALFRRPEEYPAVQGLVPLAEGHSYKAPLELGLVDGELVANYGGAVLGVREDHGRGPSHAFGSETLLAPNLEKVEQGGSAQEAVLLYGGPA